MAEHIGGGIRWFLLGLALISALAICVCTLSTCMHRGPAFLEPQDMDPSWAPDSTQVAFVCYRPQRVETRFGYRYLGPYDGLEGHELKEICISELDGSNRRQLTDNLAMDFDPSWSPDGTQIAFVSNRDVSEGANIYVMQRDGANLVRLTRRAAGYRQPRWSPHGDIVAFIQGNVGGDLYMMVADGNQVVRLTEVGWISDFDWSPDGKSIVFNGGDAPDPEIYVVDVEDDSITRLTYNQAPDFEPIWSPDGRHIAFSSEREDGVQVYVMDVQTREDVRVSEGPDPSWRASWSPSGRFLSYISGQTPNQSLYILDLESGILTAFSDFQAAADEIVKEDRVFDPGVEAHHTYNELFRIYTELYPSVAHHFQQLAELESQQELALEGDGN